MSYVCMSLIELPNFRAKNEISVQNYIACKRYLKIIAQTINHMLASWQQSHYYFVALKIGLLSMLFVILSL